MIEKPIWSTWAQYGKGVTQEDTLNFNAKIKKFGLPMSQLELDDSWANHYGDLEVRICFFIRILFYGSRLILPSFLILLR